MEPRATRAAELAELQIFISAISLESRLIEAKKRATVDFERVNAESRDRRPEVKMYGRNDAPKRPRLDGSHGYYDHAEWPAEAPPSGPSLQSNPAMWHNTGMAHYPHGKTWHERSVSK